MVVRFRMRPELLYADVVAAGGGVRKVWGNVRSELGCSASLARGKFEDVLTDSDETAGLESASSTTWQN